jgi:DNA-binding beta-propeller fold protein YncE
VAKLAISPDGKFVYAVASSVNGVSVFRRNDDGSLTQLDETDGCISDNGDDGDDGQSCASGRQLYEPTGAAISPDGATLYIAVSEARPNCESECQTRSHGPGAIVVLQRNAATGVLTQAEDASGCMTDLSRYLDAPTCRNAHGLEDLLGVAVSPDGKNVYAVGQGSGPIEVHPGALTIFARSATDGTLQQLDGTAGCVSNNGSEGGGGNDRAALADGDVCGRANGMLEPSGLAISADGANVYTLNEDSAAVAAFSRDASTGAVAQLPGTEGCVSDDGTPSGDPPSNLCTDGRALVEATRMAIVGCTAYVVARDSNAVDVFRRCTPASSAALPSCSPSGDITFTVTGRPGDAVAKTLHLRVDGGDDQKLATPAANPATVTVHFAMGTHALEFWAEDEQGLTEAHHTGSLKVGNCPQPPSGAVLGNTQGSHQCTSRRVVRIRLRKSVLRGAHVTSVTVKLVKPVRKFTVKHTGGRIRSTINLRNLPRARYTIAITVRLSDGRTLTGKRHYFTCTPARRGGLPRL